MQRVLVVDDSATMRALYKQLLARDRSCTVSFATDGADAFEKIGAEEPHIVFLDINMPQMDGLELLAKLRETSLLARVRVVLVTTEGTPEDVERGLAAGASAYLAKPFKPSQIAELVDRFARWRDSSTTVPAAPMASACVAASSAGGGKI